MGSVSGRVPHGGEPPAYRMQGATGGKRRKKCTGPRPPPACRIAVLACACALGLSSGVAGERDEESRAEVLGEGPSLTPAAIDRLFERALPEGARLELADDAAFLRRVTFDLLGRPPLAEEVEAFLASSKEDKRSRRIAALLRSEEFGRNWAEFLTEVIAYRVPPPELTFLDYRLFEDWLARRINDGADWGTIARELLTATGPVEKNAAATFIAYHQGNPIGLASETARIFLALDIRCAQCHDHPYERWKREDFHRLAAFFARVEGKLGKVQDGTGAVVSSKAKGEYRLPHQKDPSKKGAQLPPRFLDGRGLELGASDLERRKFLAGETTSRRNMRFARAFANRVWARLMGRGLYEPVDALPVDPRGPQASVLDLLAREFAASGYDIRAFLKLLLETRVYQRRSVHLPEEVQSAALDNPLVTCLATPPRRTRLRGDEIYRALEVATGLPDVRPPARKPTPEERFPPPPKSTRDLVCDAFGFDPSLPPEETPRTIDQAVYLMNHRRLQALINAAPKSHTVLSRLLEEYRDDRAAARALWLRVLARPPLPEEIDLALKHIDATGTREGAFEDLLWSLINSAEFTTRR